MENLNIGNICGGAVPERFERELLAIFRNIRDPNTDPERVRKVVLEFRIKPFADRTGAEVTFCCASKTAPADSVAGTIFITAAHGEIAAFPRDPRQDSLFAIQPDGKQPS